MKMHVYPGARVRWRAVEKVWSGGEGRLRMCLSVETHPGLGRQSIFSQALETPSATEAAEQVNKPDRKSTRLNSSHL